MSTLNVDKVDPNTGTTLELGTSGDTINIPSGVTIANSGTATGFGAVLTGSTDNTVTTVTAANAISGEANLKFDGTDLTVETGNVVIGTAGKGIDFSAQTASTTGTTTAELLDHYEEGTFVPVWTGTGTGSVTSYDNSAGHYIKIGGLCWVSMYTAYAHTSGTLTAYNVTNLPFTSSSTNAAVGTSGGREFGHTGKGMNCVITGSSTTAVMKMVDTAFVANSYIRMGCVYATA